MRENDKQVNIIYKMTKSFGNLTIRNKNLYDIREIMSKDTSIIDYLFQNAAPELEKFNVIQIERQKALENLRDLTILLQTKRLRYNTKSACKYFTL